MNTNLLFCPDENLPYEFLIVFQGNVAYIVCIDKYHIFYKIFHDMLSHLVKNIFGKFYMVCIYEKQPCVD